MEHNVMTNQAETAERNTKATSFLSAVALEADQPTEREPKAYLTADISRT
jgi:hypothetical protein